MHSTNCRVVSAMVAVCLLSFASVCYLVLRPQQATGTQVAALTFSASYQESVAMGVTDSVRYEPHSAQAADEFHKLLPHGGHVVYVHDEGTNFTEEPERYTVTLFHQLKCLDIVRIQLVDPSDGASALTRHCMNYLRQTILCRPNLRIEPAKTASGVATRTYDTVCRDWTALYAEVERNQRAFKKWEGSH